MRNLLRTLVVGVVGFVTLGVSAEVQAASTPAVQAQNLFNQMVTEMNKVSSYRYEGGYSVMPPANTVSAPLTLQFYGASYVRPLDSANKKSAATLFFKETSLEPTMPVFDVVTQDTDTYLKISHLETITRQLDVLTTSSQSSGQTVSTTLEKYGLDKVNNQWLSIPQNTVEQMITSLSPTTPATPSLSSEALLNSRDLPALSDQQVQNLLKVFNQNKVLVVREVEVGVDPEVTHLHVDINKQNVGVFLSEINKLYRYTLFTTDEITKLAADLQTKDMPLIDLWVTKKTALLKKLSMTMNMGTTLPGSEANSYGMVNLTMEFGGYNGLVFIPEPTDVKSGPEVFKAVLDKVQPLFTSTSTTL